MGQHAPLGGSESAIGWDNMRHWVGQIQPVLDTKWHFPTCPTPTLYRGGGGAGGEKDSLLVAFSRLLHHSYFASRHK